MKMNRLLVCAIGVAVLAVVGVSAWLACPASVMGKEERAVVGELKRAPEILFDVTCTNKHAYIDDVFRRIVELPADRPRKEYAHEFLERIFSMDLERHCPFDRGTREQRDESSIVYGFALVKLEHAARRGYEALARLKAPKRERWNVYWRYLAKYRDAERRMRRLFPKHGDGSLFAMRTFERKLLLDYEWKYLTDEEFQGVCSDFEKIIGRPLRTMEQIQQEADVWTKKNISESKKASGGNEQF